MFKITVATVTANNPHHKNTFENLSHNRFGKDTTFGAPSYSVKEKREKNNSWDRCGPTPVLKRLKQLERYKYIVFFFAGDQVDVDTYNTSSLGFLWNVPF